MTSISSLSKTDAIAPVLKTSAWSHIADTLAGAIAQGHYAPGQKLPSEHALAQEFGVNRHTVRRSLASLCRQGLLRVTQGSGTYVEEFAVDLVINRRASHHQSLALAGLRGGLQVISEQTLRANTRQAKALEVPVRSALLKLTILGEAQGRPLHFSERLFPLPRFHGLTAVIAATGSISAGFKTCGVMDYSRLESRVSALMPGEIIAQHLRQPVSRPVLWVESTNVDETGSPIEFASTWFAGDRVKLTVNHKE